MSIHVLDITEKQSHGTFVKTKLKSLRAGDRLEVFLNEGEPLDNVPETVKKEGHKIVSVSKVKDDIYMVVIEK